MWKIKYMYIYDIHPPLDCIISENYLCESGLVILPRQWQKLKRITADKNIYKKQYNFAPSII